MLDPSLAPTSSEAPWSTDIRRTIAIGEAGLVLGLGTCLVRMTKDGTLAVADDRERMLALLSVADRRPISPGILHHIEAAAGHWQRGDKALANLRLIFAGLSKLDDPTDAWRLRAAEYLLDEGMSPRELMKELGLDTSALDSGALDLDKFDPNQPRVPAGNGRESGRWSEVDSDNQGNRDRSADSNGTNRSTPDIVQIAADGPLKPAGLNVVPLLGTDPLDPKGLNKPLSPLEQQVIADTINTIIAGKPEDIPTLNPHPYYNRPDRSTGAVLPPGVGGYTTYYARAAGAPPGSLRILMDRGGGIYYTNNHYKSFYPVDIKIDPQKML